VAYFRAGFGGVPVADSRIAVQSSRTWTLPEIRSATCHHRCVSFWNPGG